jgi:hypothetical protein
MINQCSEFLCNTRTYSLSSIFHLCMHTAILSKKPHHRVCNLYCNLLNLCRTRPPSSNQYLVRQMVNVRIPCAPVDLNFLVTFLSLIPTGLAPFPSISSFSPLGQISKGIRSFKYAKHLTIVKLEQENEKSADGKENRISSACNAKEEHMHFFQTI